MTSLITSLAPRTRPGGVSLSRGGLMQLRLAVTKVLTVVLAFLSEHCLTLFALGMIDAGAFRASNIAGFIVTGVSAALFEHKLTPAGRSR